MTLPDNCDTCGDPLTPWDADEDSRCSNCGSTVRTWEHLNPEESRRRMRLIARRAAIEEARTVPVQGSFL